MSGGLIKPKKYDWKDSNLALFGSDLEKNIKKESAEGEEAWQGSGQEPGLRIWRVNQFKIEDWPKDDYGRFFSGDSYIILNTYKPDPESEELAYDVHFWIGKFSTQGAVHSICDGVNYVKMYFYRYAFQSIQDEYGTAAYKTVELDHFLNDAPVQHREVMNHESELFKTYFDNIQLMEGGCATGFKHVEPEQYKPRLLRYQRVGRRVKVTEVPLRQSSLNSGDVFILDKGLDVYQWNGTSANKDEKFQAMQFCQQLENERNGRAKAQTFEEESLSKAHDFYDSLSGDDVDGDDGDDLEDYSSRPRKMFRLSDAGGKMEFSLVKEGELSRDDLDSKDAFIVDAGTEVIVWIGSDASSSEKARGMEYAQLYLMDADVSLLPVSVVKEGQISAALDGAF